MVGCGAVTVIVLIRWIVERRPIRIVGEIFVRKCAVSGGSDNELQKNCK
jgi:hypothetical protein